MPTRQGQRTTGTYSVFLPFISTDASSALNSGVGIERYWTFQPFTLSDRVTVRANVWNGNVVVQYVAFNIPSRGLPLELVFTYNSLTNAWTHNLNWSLTLGVTNSVVLRDGDGTEHFFRREADGSYTAPVGNFDTLVWNADQTFTLTHPDQSQHLFDANGRLTQIRDRKGNAITLTYTSGQLTQVQAAAGQTLAFA
jgi:YD repeat-containing protein